MKWLTVRDRDGFPVEMPGFRSGCVCAFNTTVEAPAVPAKSETEAAMDTEQLALLREQNKILSEQRADTAAIKPYLYKESGYNYDPTTGAVTKMTEQEYYDSLSPIQQAQYDLNKTYLDQQKLYASGEGPVSAATEKYWQDYKAKQAEELSRRLGVNYATSTPGIQSAAETATAEAISKDAERTGKLSAYENLMLSNMNQQNQQTQQTYGNLMTTPRLYSGMLGDYSGVLGNYSQAIAPYQNERMRVYNNQVSAAMQSAANKAALWSGMLGAAGFAGGSYLGRG